jgi:hypothetical protein
MFCADVLGLSVEVNRSDVSSRYKETIRHPLVAPSRWGGEVPLSTAELCLCKRTPEFQQMSLNRMKGAAR